MDSPPLLRHCLDRGLYQTVEKEFFNSLLPAFLAPLIETTPENATPPLMGILSIVYCKECIDNEMFNSLLAYGDPIHSLLNNLT